MIDCIAGWRTGLVFKKECLRSVLTCVSMWIRRFSGVIIIRFDDLRKMGSFERQEALDKQRLTVEVVMTNFRFFAKRILDAYAEYQCMDNTSTLATYVFDSIKSNLNEYVQAFMDIVPILAISEGDARAYQFDSLRSCLRYVLSSFSDISMDCKAWLEFLQRRNEIEHEYYNYAYFNEVLKSTLLNYSDGIMELVEYCQKVIDLNDLSQLRVSRKIKKLK